MIPALHSVAFTPKRMNPPGQNTWVEHLPFACDLVRSLRPGVIVELGTHYGESYFGFCQAVAECGLECACYAVDTWKGDEHAGRYGEEVFEDVCAHNAATYSRFSRLLRMTFDEALDAFTDGQISLLHIDGRHTYEAVRHDFESWYPKVRPGAVILLHDISVHRGNFGVWKFWAELEERLPSFAFRHCNGLGVVQKPGGDAAPGIITELLQADPEARELVRTYYAVCGHRLAEVADSRISATRVQAFAPGPNGYSEERSSSVFVPSGSWQTVRLRIPGEPYAGELRLDPADRVGLVEIDEVALLDPDQPPPLWKLDATAVGQVRFEGTALQVSSRALLAVLSTGDDPRLILPETGVPVRDAVLQVRLRVVVGGVNAAKSLSGTMNIAFRDVLLAQDELARTREELRIASTREHDLRAQNHKLATTIAAVRAESADLRGSWSWRLTAPLRWAGALLLGDSSK